LLSRQTKYLKTLRFLKAALLAHLILNETADNRLFVKIKEQQIMVSKMVRFVSFAAVCSEARVATCTSEADESCWSTERRGWVEENKKGAEFLSRMALSAAMEADRRGVHQVAARREYEKTQQVRIKICPSFPSARFS